MSAAPGPTGRYDALSPWITAPSDPQPALDHDLRADVAIVGGGYMGLSAALALRRAGADVVLIERQFCGAGASGRNAGHLTPTIGKDVYTCIRQWGPERGLALAAFAEDAVGTTEAVIRDLDIACDYVASGNIVAGLHPEHRGPLEAAAAKLAKVGLPATFLDEGAMSARGLPGAFQFGVLEGRGGHLDPGKYVSGLRAAALAAGVRLFEGTEALSLSSVMLPQVRTARGTVFADQVFVATNAYVEPDLAHAAGRILPLRVTLFRTAPLNAMQRVQLGWSGGEGVYTAHEIMESYRISADGRLVGGSKWVDLGHGRAETPQPPDPHLSRYDALIAQRFPEAPGLRIEAYWSGWIGATVDHLPIHGTVGRHSNIHYALGCNGHGVALATHIGAAVADLMLGRPRPDLDVLRRWTPDIPTAVLRRMAFRLVAGPLERRDARIDRDLGFGRS